MQPDNETLPRRRIISLMVFLLYGTCFSLLVVSFLALNRLQTAIEEAPSTEPAPLIEWSEFIPVPARPDGRHQIDQEPPADIEPVRLVITPVQAPAPADQAGPPEEAGGESPRPQATDGAEPGRRITTTMPPSWPLEQDLPFESIRELKQTLERVLSSPDSPTPAASRRSAAAITKPSTDEEPPILDLGPTRPVIPTGVQASRGLGPSDQIARNEGQALLIGLGSARLRALLPLAAASASVSNTRDHNYSRVLLSNGDEEHCSAHIPVVIPGDWDIRPGGIVEAEMKTTFDGQEEVRAEPRGKDATRQGDAPAQE